MQLREPENELANLPVDNLEPLIVDMAEDNAMSLYPGRFYRFKNNERGGLNLWSTPNESGANNKILHPLPQMSMFMFVAFVKTTKDGINTEQVIKVIHADSIGFLFIYKDGLQDSIEEVNGDADDPR